MKPKRLVIVGGVAGGASAAARARRLCEACEITVFERGPHASFANCGLPYFVGGEIVAPDNLLVHAGKPARPLQPRRAGEYRRHGHRPHGAAGQSPRAKLGS